MATVPKRVLCGLQLSGASYDQWGLPSAVGLLGMLHADTVDVVTSLLLLCIAPIFQVRAPRVRRRALKTTGIGAKGCSIHMDGIGFNTSSGGPSELLKSL